MTIEKKGFYESVEFELHELSQPLTTLRCRLELALMLSGEAEPDRAVALLEAVQEGLNDVKRIFASVEKMRQRLLNES